MKHIDEVLGDCYGVVLSRTFQLINKKNKLTMNELISRLITKCNHYGKPIFINIDYEGDFQDEPKLKSKEIMNNILEGYDGYIVEVNKFIADKRIDIEFSQQIINKTINLIKEAEKQYDKKFTNPAAKLKYLRQKEDLKRKEELKKQKEKCIGELTEVSFNLL